MSKTPNSYRIDSHQHFWQYDPVRYSWIDDNSMAVIQRDFLPQDLAPLLLKNHIYGCIAVQADQSEGETEFLLKLADKHEFIKGVVGWVDLTAENVEERLELYSQNSMFRGVRSVVFDKNGEFMRDPNFQNGISCLKKFGLTYDILAFDYQLPGAVELVRKFPEQAFVLDHMGKPQISKGVSEKWRQNIRKLAECENVSCKISGLVTETNNFQYKVEDFHPFLNEVLTAFGEDRLMFGSDWPVCLIAASYSEVLKIAEDFFTAASCNTENIFGKNAARFYNIGTGNG